MKYKIDWESAGAYNRLVKTIAKDELVLPCNIKPIYKLTSISDGSNRYGGADQLADWRLTATIRYELEIPAFYTIIPGAHFRERALGTSVGMFAAKHIAENRNPAEAIVELKKIDKDIPGKYYIKFYLGSCHIGLGDPDSALKYFEAAMNLEPYEQDIPSVYSYMGIAFKDLAEYGKALDVLKKGAQLDPERTDIYNLMGYCHFKLKEHEAAIENFKKVIELDPSSAIDYANIASNYRNMGETAKAIRYYEMALTLDASIEFAKDNMEKLKKQNG